jgi:hypothetical protein
MPMSSFGTIAEILRTEEPFGLDLRPSGPLSGAATDNHQACSSKSIGIHAFALCGIARWRNRRANVATAAGEIQREIKLSAIQTRKGGLSFFPAEFVLS